MAAPTITSIDPIEGTPDGGNQVTLTGTNFVSGMTVDFGGKPATNVVIVNSTTATCDAPSELWITGISPATGTDAGGESVTITGRGFEAGATFTIGGAAVTNLVIVNSTTATCDTPAGTAGDADVVVTVGADSATLTDAFEYTAPPWTPLDAVPPPTAFHLMSDDSTKTLSAGLVDQLDDKTGNGHNFTQGVAARKPADNAGESITFTDPDWMDGNRTVALTSQSVVACFEYSASSNQFARVFTQRQGTGNDFNESGHYIPINRQTNTNEFGSQVGSVQARQALSVGNNTFSSIHDGTQISNRANGGTEATVAHTLNVTMTEQRIGDELPNAGGFGGLTGRYWGLVQWDNVEISDDVRQRTEGFFAHHVDAITGTTEMQDRLPPGHPYKSAPP